MDKSPDAFRTISEVADHLDTPAHVLRFWESRFPQIRPVKRAGGRRYYRPADVALLTGIKRLLHDEGLTIRGVQKILREHGVRHVAGLSGEPLPDDIEMDAEAALEAALAANFGAFDGESVSPERAESATIVALETASLTQGNLAAALRALPAGAFAPHPEAIALHARLVALQQTLLAPPVFGRA
jgi:DNA-binding transcriptional MerR regulator